jgi:hypothetical protein
VAEKKKLTEKKGDYVLGMFFLIGAFFLLEVPVEMAIWGEGCSFYGSKQCIHHFTDDPLTVLFGLVFGAGTLFCGVIELWRAVKNGSGRIRT